MRGRLSALWLAQANAAPALGNLEAGSAAAISTPAISVISGGLACILGAAPASHRVLLENDRVRVLEVVIEPRTREPEHTHQAASVMIVDEPARIRYYQGDALQYESQARFESPPGVRVRWMEPEGPHSVQNIDERRYHAIRVELK